MIDNRRVVAVVPARGGSKGVPGKNLREVAGVSLLHRALQTATACNYVDAVVVSSDDDAILQHAGLVPGVLTLLRPSELATDASSMAPVVDHVLSIHDADIVVLLQPTSPLREVHDIKGGLERFVAAGADSLVSVCPARTSPYWMYRLTDNGRLQSLLPKPDAATRQELPETYQVNGALYVVRASWFAEHHVFVDEQTVAYVMPVDRSIDIDNPEDLIVAEAVLRRHKAALDQ
jgi:N-acylneuraminate cytidylyltransferase